MLQRFVLLAAVVAVALPFAAQQPQLQQGPKPAAATIDVNAIPVDKLLAFTVAHNGLGEEVGQPWHVKATFQLIDGIDSGKFEGFSVGKFNSGTYEETWYAPMNYSRTYEFKGHKHTDIATPEGVYRSGAQVWPSLAELGVRELLVQPVPTSPLEPSVTLRHKDVLFGKTSVPCLFEVPAPPPGTDVKEAQEEADRAPHVCFEPGVPALRFTAGIGTFPAATTFSQIKKVNGRFIPQDIQVFASGEPVIRIHVEDVGPVPSPTGPMTPPADAVLLKGPIVLPWDVVVNNRLPSPTNRPVMPIGAALNAIQDTINIDVVIAADGSVTSAKVVNGEPFLRQTALESVQKSKFKPFLLSGNPVEVHTQAHIDMSYGSSSGGGRGRH